jgi:hypothetical protein
MNGFKIVYYYVIQHGNGVGYRGSNLFKNGFNDTGDYSSNMINY